MNHSLELIKSEIYDAKTNLEKFTKLQKNEPKNTNYSFYKTYFTNRLTILQQIKSELEAWYVLKPDLEHTENSLGEHEIELRKFYTDADVEQDDTKEKYYILKKALEVEDER